MIERTLTIKYLEFSSSAELDSADAELLNKAIEATASSYAPYSKFNVGAALLMDNGEIVAGSNQENAAYPSGLCAERTTVFHASAAYPGMKMKTIAIAAKSNGELTEAPTYPCGACLQVLAEYQMRGGEPIRVILGSKTKILVFSGVEGLLPFIFDNLE